MKEPQWWELTTAERSGAAHTLVASSNYMRFALDTAEGQDVTSGMPLSLLLGGHWIAGRVEHNGTSYIFIATDGTRCGLTLGMTVRLA